MFRFALLFLIVLFSLGANSQVTHSVSFTLGIANTWCKSEIQGSKNATVIFLPTTSIDYNKHNDNIFWGGAGVGFSFRRIPFYEYSNGQKTGIEMAEYWLRVRAGFKFEREFLTHLPYLGLGIGGHTNYNIYSKNGNTSINYSSDTIFKSQPIHPFLELGNKLINSSFRQDSRNVSFTFALRYYPMPLFKSPVHYEYAYQQYKDIQYHMYEFLITAAFQLNVQK